MHAQRPSLTLRFHRDLGIISVRDVGELTLRSRLLPLFEILWDNKDTVLSPAAIKEMMERKNEKSPSPTSISADISSIRFLLGARFGVRDLIQTVTKEGYIWSTSGKKIQKEKPKRVPKPRKARVQKAKIEKPKKVRVEKVKKGAPKKVAQIQTRPTNPPTPPAQVAFTLPRLESFERDVGTIPSPKIGPSARSDERVACMGFTSSGACPNTVRFPTLHCAKCRELL